MTLRGQVDLATRQRIGGWAQDTEAPQSPVGLVIASDTEVIGRVLANRYRKDLDLALIGNGRCSFDLILPRDLLLPHKRHFITVRREADGTHLSGSPLVLEPASAFNEDVRDYLARLISNVDDDADLECRRAFLADQSQIVARLYADRASGVEAREWRRFGRWDQFTNGHNNRPKKPEEQTRPRALVVDDRVRVPQWDSSACAIWSHLQSLQRIGFDVTFAAADLDGDVALLEAAGFACCSRRWFGSIEEVLSRQAGAFDLVYLNGAQVGSCYSALARRHQPQAKLVLNVAALHYLRAARQAHLEQRPDLLAESRRLEAIEFASASFADAVITHSEFEAGVLRQRLKPEKIHVVPWAVALRPTTKNLSSRRGLAMIGNYAHSHNVDAAHYLVEAVMPEIRRLDLAITCFIVGNGMPEHIWRLAAADVEIVGSVEDLGEIFDKVRLTVAPLAYGNGIKSKVLESLAAGVPCVCTPSAIEGLDLPRPLLDLVANSPYEMAQKILSIHEDLDFNSCCRAAGLSFITDLTSDARIDAQLGAAVRRMPLPVASG